MAGQLLQRWHTLTCCNLHTNDVITFHRHGSLLHAAPASRGSPASASPVAFGVLIDNQDHDGEGSSGGGSGGEAEDLEEERLEDLAALFVRSKHCLI